MTYRQDSRRLYEEPEVLIERILASVEKAVVGKREAVEAAVVGLLCGGHLLLEDLPGVGKTTLVRALARTLDCSFRRIQFTPDLLPSDVTGVSVFDSSNGTFAFREGPLFASVVLADELNRTPAKVQAALLEAMEEGQVTVDGTSHRLPAPFLLLATQNPADCEGTYRLPEALLDRFLLRIRLGYPSPEREVEMLGRHADSRAGDLLRPVLLREELLLLQREVRRVHADDSVKRYIVRLAEETRRHPAFSLGASPRATLALLLAAQGQAFADGRRYVVPDDVKAMLDKVWAHRIRPAAEVRFGGAQTEAVLQDIVRRVPVPGISRAAGE
ncbi:hypothetical protein J31TS4_44000 [Paenibacillus sp. J31TS4]|uniref:AAA family ATPase n=1 Tax=Paenibacillus sp. J31TS4 TaxID=2807195 RepID=UPI001B26EB7E|nr:AAA family ATPase [Paenibacillus sp. J31TS4]GIP41120.1 hypothetical protein J31TS4_44000 [Paenibacillus sp. J31TS4]